MESIRFIRENDVKMPDLKMVDISGCIARKRKECAEIARIPTAAEFDRCYNS